LAIAGFLGCRISRADKKTKRIIDKKALTNILQNRQEIFAKKG
jgi:hypothetical protein